MEIQSAMGLPSKAALQALLGFPNTSVDNAAIRADGTVGGMQTSGLIIDDSVNLTGILSINGTATNDNAAAGKIGEFISSIVTSAAGVSLTSNTSATVTSIPLTAGDWDVAGACSYLPTTTTSFTRLHESISLVNNTLDVTDGSISSMLTAAIVPGIASDLFFRRPVGPVRISLAGTTTIYLVTNAIFTASTLKGGGILRARRVR